jgi:hypothetical protein
LLNATRQVGAAIGVAVMLSIVATDVTGETGNAGLAGGYRLALLASAGLAALGALVSLALPARGNRGVGAGSRRERPAARYTGVAQLANGLRARGDGLARSEVAAAGHADSRRRPREHEVAGVQPTDG